MFDLLGDIAEGIVDLAEDAVDATAGVAGHSVDMLSDLVVGKVPRKSEVINLINNGYTIMSIADATGLSIDTIERIFSD